MLPPHPSTIIVTAIYEDVQASQQLFHELENLFGQDVYIVAIDDGSIHQPLSIGLMQDVGISGTILYLAHNVGHQRAISLGLHYTALHLHPHQNVVVMDADGEDIPANIPHLLTSLSSEVTDLVISPRVNRENTIFFKMFYGFYKYFFRALTGRRIDFGNFMAIKAHAVKRLVTMTELDLHIPATVLASKLRYKKVPLSRGARYAGQSKMNFVSLSIHAFKGLMVFAEDVLVRVGIACAIICAFTVLCSIIIVILKVFGFAILGWASTIIGILMLVFLQTGATALMTLMLTGISRGQAHISKTSHSELIQLIEQTPAR